jgi:sulfur carrier protein
MTFTLNGRPDSLESEQLSVVELLKLKDVEMPEMVSVQVNGDILERAAFESTIVSDGDEVEFLYFMGGGAS